MSSWNVPRAKTPPQTALNRLIQMMAATGTLVLNAPAKVNLFLHVIARREDGYHDLSSLAVFTEFGDQLKISRARDQVFELDVTGPFADQISTGDDNLVLQAARKFFVEKRLSGSGVRIALEKNIPVAAGLGGGSSDAAATLHGLNRFWQRGLDTHDLQELGRGLGADVAMCVAGAPSWVGGIGDQLSPVSAIPDLPMLLVNPGIQLSTPQVFGALKTIPDFPDSVAPDHFSDIHALVEFLNGRRNDLEAPAIGIVPEIADALALLDRQPACLLARMSGSGATLFGLFPDRVAVAHAAANIRVTNPNWWVMETLALGSRPQ
jgi:4-diphosphocytidyl-2-C-methyl-D-erythritol kinase